jgi:hypothetical protein
LTTVETLADEATPERRGLLRAGTDAVLKPFTESIRMDGLQLLAGTGAPGWPGRHLPVLTAGDPGVAVVVNDVTADPCYLRALSRAIVPVVDADTATVVGTLGTEAAERDAFTDPDRQAPEGCAAAITGLLPKRTP